MSGANPILPAVNQHLRALGTRVRRRRSTRFVVAFIGVAMLATAFVWTSGRAASNGLHWPAALTRIFTSPNAGANTAIINGVSSFSDWTLAEPAAVVPGSLQFSAANYNDNETNSDHTATITVTRTGGTDGAVSVHWATSAGTATAGTDYTEASGDLNWADTDAADKTFTVTVKGDTDYEANETVNLELSNPSVASLGAPATATLTITNDDAVPANQTLVVNTTDDLDFGACVTAHCSLREAINAANSLADANTINFNIPNGFISGGVFTIQPTSALPTILRNITIDGTTQDTFGGNTNPNGPDVVVNGSLAGVTTGLYISGDNNTIKGLVVNGFNGGGIGISYPLDSTPSNNQILNNYIGTDAAGTAAVPNTGGGIDVHGSGAGGPASGNTVMNNLISGNTGVGLDMCDAAGTAVSSNLIGTDRTGTSNLGNSSHGIALICGSDNNNVMTTNTIAFNGGDGFFDQPDYRFGDMHHGNKLTQNSIFSNTGLGINLNPPPWTTIDGVTPNDTMDPDTGANGLQNFPIITSSKVTGPTKTITGTLNSTASQTFTIEFFANTVCDGSGNGEGKTYLGATPVTTDGSGDGSFTFHPSSLTVGDVITATATDASNNTSEFSACFTTIAGTAGTLQFSSATYSVAENVGGGLAHITVTRTGGSDGDVSARFDTSNGSATAGSDYTAVTNYTVTFLEGDTSPKTIDIPITNDSDYEANETVNLELSNPSVASLGVPATATLTITNDDAAPTFTIDDVTHDEGNGGPGTTVYTFTITKTGATELSSSVNYETVNGTATAPLDFTAVLTTNQVFQPLDTTKQITVLVNGDTTVEPDEAFTVHLSSPVDATIADADGTGTITNDDTDVSVAVSPLSVAEDGGPNLVYTFTRTGVTTGPLTINFSVGGTASFPGDYLQTDAASFSSSSGTVTFGAGNPTTTVTIDPTTDPTYEANETVILTVTSGSGYNVGTPNPATGTITNDDNPPTILVVNSTADTDDGFCLQAPDGNCTLREAINAANALPDANTIRFNIPLSDPNFADGVFTIKPLTGEYTLTSGLTTIDGATQTTFSGDTNPAGPEIVIDGSSNSCGPFTCSGFTISSPGNIIRSLVINNVTAYGIAMFGAATGNTIQGCYIGTDPTGTVAAGNAAFGITSPGGNTIGGLSAGEGNVISGNGFPVGFGGIGLSGSTDTIRGNKIGTNAAGTAALANKGSGIVANGGGGHLIEGNLISGNTLYGIEFANAPTDSNTVKSNKIGTDAGGTLPIANGSHGIRICCGAGNNTIGGSSLGDGNVIAFNGGAGVVVHGLPSADTGATGNRIFGNSIFENTGLGIDLANDGVTPNDAGDGDTDPDANNLQNFPIIRAALIGGPNTIRGTLNSTPAQTFTIDLYASPACDASGNGEGKTWLGSTTTTTGANGDGLWSLNPVTLTPGDAITATATDSLGNTSEFSACFTARLFTPGTIAFAQANTDSTETNSGSHTVDIVVTRTGGSDGAVSVQYDVTGGSATTADSDYSVSAPSGTFNWANGNSAPKTITITVNGDTKFELDETVNLTLSNVTGGAAIGTNPATLTIKNDDTQPTISINDVSHAEGASGTTDYDFTVSLSNASYQTITVNAATADDTATTGNSDYTAVPSTMLTFTPNQTTQHFHVLVNGDLTIEPDEQFFVDLSGASNATFLDNRGVGTITNDDTDVTVAVSPSSVAEDGAPNLVYTFTRSPLTSGPITVNFSVGGTAEFGTDYTQTGAATFGLTSGTVIIPNGSTTATVTIDPTTDSTVELDETVNLTVISGTGYNVGSPSSASGTITNDDTDITVAVVPTSVLENGATVLVYTFTRTGITSGAITVNFSVGGTASFPSDYAQSGAASFSSSSGTVTFGDGITTATVTINPTGDTTYELNETVILTVTSGSGYNPGVPAAATGRITNDDDEPTLGINNITANEGTLPAGTTSFIFTVTRTGSTQLPATVNFATAPGNTNPATGGASCTAGVDYVSQTGMLTFPPSAGPNSQTITIAVCRDATVEANETFFIELSGETEATISDGQGRGTIQNDDAPPPLVPVNTTNDVDDGFCNVAHCSLREAINTANLGAGAVSITFAIPADDPRHFYYANDGVPGQVTLANVTPTTASDDTTIVGIDPDWPHSWWSILPTSALPTITQTVAINGYSQTGSAANTLTGADNAVLTIELSGESAGASVTGLTLNGGTSNLRGLVINRFSGDGLSLPGGNSDVAGNFIGTDVSGTLDLGNTGSGISSAGVSESIGGSLPADVNLISGNDGDGISFTDSNSDLVLGNLIGTKANGTSALGNGGNGISFSGGGSVFNTIGGTPPGEGNTIAFNGGDGVQVAATAGIGNAIRGNSIFSNGTTNLHLGIDLDADGVTLNDLADTDPSPSPQRANNLQNFPIITLALVTGSTKTINGTLNSTVGETFDIDFYANSSCDNSGNGEGQTYLGSTTVATDASGNVSFTFHPNLSHAPFMTVGKVITATATTTGASFNTSEFSVCFPVSDGSSGAGDIQFDPSQTFQVAENDSNHYYQVKLVRVGGNNGQIQTTLTTSDGTATAGSDYTDSDQTVIFDEGESSKTINIPISDDSTYEGNETVNLSLGSTQINAARSDDSATQLQPQADPHAAVLTITDNDTAPTFTIDDVTHNEGNSGTTAYTFTVTKAGNSTQLNATVDYATVNGTATAPSDFTAILIPATTLTFLPADTTKQFTVLVNGDTTFESTEAFTVQLSNVVNATISDADGTGTITNDDSAPTFAIDDVTHSEGNGGTTAYTFTVTKTGSTALNATVDYATVAGTATSPSDFTAIPTTTLTFLPADTTKQFTVLVNGDTAFEANEVFTAHLSNAGNATISDADGAGTILNDDAIGGIIRFSAANYNTTENSHSTTITVERVGDTTQAVTVDYATPDDSAAVTVTPCATINGLASPRCDFTTALGTLKFAVGESSKTFNVLISQDNYVEGPETLALTLSNLTGGAAFSVPSTATLTIADDATEPATNPIDDANNFVRQHYHDFLNREPDASGLAFWTNEITSCGTNAQCIEVKRINVSGAFYLSIEFQNTGYLVERLYKTSYADVLGTSTIGGAHQLAVPIVRFSEFLSATQTIGQGVVVGQTGWETVLENNKRAFTLEFVQRSRFTTAYANTLTPAQFVDMLFANAGVLPTSVEKQAAIDEFGLLATNTADVMARSRALRDVAESSTLVQQEFNRAFVLMEFFGYLRRNPNAAPDSDYTGYDFWLTKLNQFNGNFQDAEMVKAFISSLEYRNRFGP